MFCRFIRNSTVCLDSYPEKEAAQIGTASLLYRHLYSYISAHRFQWVNFFAFFQNYCPQTPFPSGNGWGFLRQTAFSKNFSVKADRTKKNDFQPVFLDAAELQHLFEVVKGTKLELPVLVAAFYGLRVARCWGCGGQGSEQKKAKEKSSEIEL